MKLESEKNFGLMPENRFKALSLFSRVRYNFLWGNLRYQTQVLKEAYKLGYDIWRNPISGKFKYGLPLTDDGKTIVQENIIVPVEGEDLELDFGHYCYIPCKSFFEDYVENEFSSYFTKNIAILDADSAYKFIEDNFKGNDRFIMRKMANKFFPVDSECHQMERWLKRMNELKTQKDAFKE